MNVIVLLRIELYVSSNYFYGISSLLQQLSFYNIINHCNILYIVHETTAS
jgi:hypothetical protein